MTNIKNEIRKIDTEIGFEKARLERIKMKYKRECGNFLKRLFITDENYILKKKNLESEISSQKDLISYLETRLLTSTTLSFDSGMEFFAEVISLVEDEKYSFQKLSLSKNNLFLPFGGYTNECFYQTIDTQIAIIARDKIIKKEAKENNCSPKQLMDSFVENNEKHISIPVFYELEIFKGREVPKYLIIDFPYLEQVCTEIVSLKLKNPDISEEVICQEYLKNLKMKLRIRRGAYYK